MSDSDKFHLRFYLNRNTEGSQIGNTYDEPADAVDHAERLLDLGSVEIGGRVEIYFNGQDHPHTTVFKISDSELGILNHKEAMWPVFFIEGSGGGVMLEDAPYEIKPEGRHKKDDDAESMNVGGEDDEDDDDDYEDDSENGEDESDEDDEGSDEDDADDDSEGDSDDSENEDSEDADDEDGDDPDTGDGDETGDSENEDDGDSDDEQEAPLPRLNIFAKMKGPTGWRKRAEMKDEARNVFALKVGVLDADESKTAAQREKQAVALVEFIETDDDRKAGLLRMRLPDGVTTEDFNVTKSGWITVRVPYPRED